MDLFYYEVNGRSVIKAHPQFDILTLAYESRQLPRNKGPYVIQCGALTSHQADGLLQSYELLLAVRVPFELSLAHVDRRFLRADQTQPYMHHLWDSYCYFNNVINISWVVWSSVQAQHRTSCYFTYRFNFVHIKMPHNFIETSVEIVEKIHHLFDKGN